MAYYTYTVRGALFLTCFLTVLLKRAVWTDDAHLRRINVYRDIAHIVFKRRRKTSRRQRIYV